MFLLDVIFSAKEWSHLDGTSFPLIFLNPNNPSDITEVIIFIFDKAIEDIAQRLHRGVELVTKPSANHAVQNPFL